MWLIFTAVLRITSNSACVPQTSQFGYYIAKLRRLLTRYASDRWDESWSLGKTCCRKASTSVFMLFCLISLHYVNGINKVMMMMMMTWGNPM